MEKCKQNESEARGMATTGKEIADAYSYPAYIGLNVHKETISVSVAAAGDAVVRSIEVRLRIVRKQCSCS